MTDATAPSTPKQADAGKGSGQPHLKGNGNGNGGHKPNQHHEHRPKHDGGNRPDHAKAHVAAPQPPKVTAASPKPQNRPKKSSHGFMVTLVVIGTLGTLGMALWPDYGHYLTGKPSATTPAKK